MTEEGLNATQILLKLSEKRSLVRECVQVILREFVRGRRPYTREDVAEHWEKYNVGRFRIPASDISKAFDEAWDFLIENKAISVRAVN